MATGMYRAKGSSSLAPGVCLQRIELVRESRCLPAPVTSALDMARLIRPHMEGLHRETFVVVPLSSKHAPLGMHLVSIGTVASSLVHPRECFLPAILSGASAIVVAHNHPSGCPEPSQEDRDVTDRLREVGHLLGIPLLDHLILGREDFFTFSGEATLPFPNDKEEP